MSGTRINPLYAAAASQQPAPSNALMALQPDTFGYPIRTQLFQGEADYFRQNPRVAGMAADDGQIILNPHASLSRQELAAVARNEGARLYMRDRGIVPGFDITDEQRALFEGTPYADNPDAMRQTLAARIISGDPSAMATPAQIAEARRIFRSGE